MQMSGRYFAGSQGYRYGYQGSEKDDEVKGSGNSYTTEFRMLDPRIGRWLSIDPLSDNFPWQTPYCSMDNNPIYYADPKGDSIIIQNTWKNKETGKYENFQVVYKDGVLYDKSGKEYTAQKGGYIEKVQLDLIELEGTHERVKNIINALEKSVDNHIITNYDDYHVKHRTDSYNREVFSFDRPKSTVTQYNGEAIGEGGKMTPRLAVLGHELTHAYDTESGNYKWRYEKRAGINKTEIHAVKIENLIGEYLKIELRRSYSGKPIPELQLKK